MRLTVKACVCVCRSSKKTASVLRFQHLQVEHETQNSLILSYSSLECLKENIRVDGCIQHVQLEFGGRMERRIRRVYSPGSRP